MNYLLKEFFFHTKKVRPCSRPGCMCIEELFKVLNKNISPNPNINETYENYRKCKNSRDEFDIIFKDKFK